MEDLHQCKGIFDEWITLLDAEEGKQIKLKKSELQKVFPEVKKTYIDQMAQYKTLELLEGTQTPEEWPINMDSVEQDLKQTREKVMDVTLGLEGLQEELEDLISTSQINYDRLQKKLEESERKLEEVEKKKHVLTELEQKQESTIQGMVERNIPTQNFDKALIDQREKLSQMVSCREQAEFVANGLKEEIEILKEECKEREKLVTELKQEVDKKNQEKIRINQQWNGKREWLQKILSTVINLSGIEVLSSSDTSVKLKVKSLLRDAVSSDLILKFDSQGKTHQSTLSGAEINLTDVDISDIVAEAVNTNDPLYLIYGFQQLLDTHAPLIQEIDDLRKEYAVDYLREEGILRLMMGSKGQIICTLKIEHGYPKNGSVKLTALEGIQTNQQLEDLKPSKENPRLTDWVRFLQTAVNAL